MFVSFVTFALKKGFMRTKGTGKSTEKVTFFSFRENHVFDLKTLCILPESLNFREPLFSTNLFLSPGWNTYKIQYVDTNDPIP